MLCSTGPPKTSRKPNPAAKKRKKIIIPRIKSCPLQFCSEADDSGNIVTVITKNKAPCQGKTRAAPFKIPAQTGPLIKILKVKGTTFEVPDAG